MKRVALATMKSCLPEKYPEENDNFLPLSWDEEPLLSEKLLIGTLKNYNITAEAVAWNDPEINWQSFDLVLTRSTFDYTQHPAEFRQWLDELTRKKVQIGNSSDIIKWNMHKGYLAELREKGVSVPKSVYVRREDIPQLKVDEIMQFEGWGTCIVKPCFGAASVDVIFIKTQTDARNRKEELRELYTNRDILLQEYIPEITKGETSCYFFGQKYTHSILKVPKKGDFRAMFSLGANITSTIPPPEVVEVASYISRCAPKGTQYARVDMVQRDNSDVVLLELELIEPALYLSFSPVALETFCKVISKLVRDTE